MKVFALSSTALCCFMASSFGENTDPSEPQKRPSHEDIAKKQQTQQEQKTASKSPPEKDVVPAKKRSLIAQSTLLSSGNQWTLVPKGAVIHIPLRLKEKITLKPQGNLVDWKVFLRKNHGWIHVHTVTMAQAQGKESINLDAIKAYKTMGKVVVAACSGGPISIPVSSLSTAGKK